MPGAPAYVFDFTQGSKDQKDLLGGKGANLAEMTNLGLPVPPGFTITTEACRSYLAKGKEPGELRVQVTMALRHLEDSARPAPRRPARPAAGQRALRREVLDARDDGDGPQHRPQRRQRHRPGRGERQRAVRLGLLPPPDPDVRQDGARHRRRAVRRRARRGQEGQGRLARHRARRRGPAGAGAAVQGHRARGLRPRLPAAPARAARPGDPRGLRLVEHRPRAALPPPRADPARPGHRGERVHDGVRQPRRGLRHRRRVHPRPVDRRARRRTATTWRTRRARTSSPASATPCPSTTSRACCPRRTPS